jgi:sugar-specific transcriptional regulator TrmB
MSESEIIDCLEKLNFTKLESQIYLVLLKGGPLSGYQIAKKIDISRSSIYNALDHMYEKGIVLLLPDNAATYLPENPTTLFKKLTYEYSKNASKASEGLIKLFETQHEERFSNFKGFETVIFKTRELLLNAESEVYINTDLELSYFKDEFKTLKERGIRVIVFSFMELDISEIEAEVHSHNRVNTGVNNHSRLMIVVDSSITLVADTYKERGTWVGAITNNPLMISIITEHIHNDIYLLNLRKRHGPNLFDDEIRIHSKFEIDVRSREKKS